MKWLAVKIKVWLLNFKLCIIFSCMHIHTNFSIFSVVERGSSQQVSCKKYLHSKGKFMLKLMDRIQHVKHTVRFSLQVTSKIFIWKGTFMEKAMAPHPSTLAWKNPMDGGAWWATVHRVAQSRTRLSDFTFTFHFHVLEKEMSTHSSVLAWRIPGMGEPHGLPSMGSHRVRHDWSDLAVAAE